MSRKSGKRFRITSYNVCYTKLLRTLLAGLLFGMLSSAQPLMESNSIPKEITFIIQGLVVVFIAIRVGFRMFIAYTIKKKNAVGGSEETPDPTGDIAKGAEK